MKPALHAECENKWASSSAPVAGGGGLLVASCLLWSYSRYLGVTGVALVGGGLFVAFVIALVYHLRNGPGTVVAGDDGVEVRWGRNRQFVRYCDLDRVLTDSTRFRLVTQTGTVVAVRLRGLAPRTGLRDTPIVKRIIRRSDDPKLSAPLRAAEPFARGHRDANAWLDSLAELLPVGGSYRGAALDRALLARIVKSGRSAPTARAACAWLLRSTGFDAGEEDLVRSAAAATACLELGQTLEAIAIARTSPDALVAHMALVPATR